MRLSLLSYSSVPWPAPSKYARAAALLLALLAVFGVASPVQAQQPYAVEEVLSEAEWTAEHVADGVTWRHARLGGLFGLPQSISVLDIDLAAEGVEVDIVSADSGRVETSVLARQAGAVAAVNGSFFDVENGGTVVFSQRDGRPLKQSSSGAAVPAFRNEAAVAAERDGDATVIRKAGPRWQTLARFEDVLSSGPLLLWDSRAAALQNASFNVTHHPRTAIGITENGHLLMVTVDGRAREAAGMTTRELAWVMRGLGCTSALNLDGGGSTTMWIRGRGVVNYPSDNKKYDHEGERAVANAVVVRVHR